MSTLAQQNRVDSGRDWANRGQSPAVGSFRNPENENGQDLGGGHSGLGPDALSNGSTLNGDMTSGVSYQVHIVGEVKNPGTYRLTASDRLQEALQRAGGVLERGSLRNVIIRRRGVGTRSYDIVRFRRFGNLQDNPYLLDNDVVQVPLRKQAVQVVGSIERPDVYELRGERTVADILTLAGGPSVGVEHNAPVKVIRFIDGQKTLLDVPLSEARTAKILNGDVIYVPSVLTANNKFDYNVIKLPGDQPFYPAYEDRVFVLGGVYNPGPYNFNPYYGVSQYLTLAGGTTKLAHRSGMRVIHQDGSKQMIGHHDVKINPGDTIYTPESRLAPENWLQILLSIAQFSLTTYVITR